MLIANLSTVAGIENNLDIHQLNKRKRKCDIVTQWSIIEVLKKFKSLNLQSNGLS